jgi:putative PEP-CTERM system TPR-repeat lipoprotein
VQISAALAQLASGNNTAAAISSLEAIAAVDKSPRADLILISAMLQAKDLTGAMKALDALQAKRPDEPLPYHLRGRIQLTQHDTAGARASFETALSKDEQYFPAAASLSALDLAEGKSEMARQRLEGLLSLNPANQLAKLALAEMSARSGAPAAAVTQELVEAVKINPDEPRAHLLLVNQMLAAGNSQGALTAAQSATAALPGSTELLDALGRAQIANGEDLQAVSTFRRLTGLHPQRVAHHLRLAEALATGKNFEQATRSLRHALELQPGLLIAQQALIGVAMAAGKPQDALRAARDVQADRPKEAIGFALAGDVEFERKDWGAAIVNYRAALQRENSSTRSALQLHQALLRSGKQLEAGRFAQDWQKTHAKDASFRFYLGDNSLAESNFEAAEQHYRAVLEINPKNSLAMNNIAWLMAKQSKPGAVALAAQANALSPNSAQLLDTLATAQAAEGQLAQAIASQKRALGLAPKDPSIKLNLAQLYSQAGEKSLARAELEALAALGERFQRQSEVTALMQKLQ